MKSLLIISLICTFVFFSNVGDAQILPDIIPNEVENLQLNDNGSVEILLDKNEKSNYGEIKISSCDKCPDKKCQLCFDGVPYFAIIPQKKDKEYLLKLPEGMYSVEVYSEVNPELNIFKQFKVLPNQSISIVL